MLGSSWKPPPVRRSFASKQDEINYLGRRVIKWLRKDWLDRFADTSRTEKGFRDDVDSLQDGLFLQADRYVRVGDRKGAKKCMIEAHRLSTEHGVRLDKPLRDLLKDLAPDLSA
jgi:hypothetical protein